ncbi:cell division protein ZapA [Paludibaculum fermentans]|uniref:Cell division protein ZapA n=1 Tax=Paludibaculum fermentans TaxID=1473598 RepID=A0A7S7NV03_PALFE|nr:cell division protein ZapA [Paludibaculum fermentans]QOY90236.1 cell division protein ZapA [Paludibaculum fermentans]
MDAGSNEKKLVRVTIFQQPYTLRSSGESGDTEALAHAVDDLMNQIATRSAGADPTRVAVLACLHLADKVRQREQEYKLLRTRLEELDERLSETMQIDD